MTLLDRKSTPLHSDNDEVQKGRRDLDEGKCRSSGFELRAANPGGVVVEAALFSRPKRDFGAASNALNSFSRVCLMVASFVSARPLPLFSSRPMSHPSQGSKDTGKQGGGRKGRVNERMAESFDTRRRLQTFHLSLLLLPRPREGFT